MVGLTMQGKRIENPLGYPYEPGDYYKDEVGDWRGRTPNGLYVWLKNHHVEEHEDGTITVVAGGWGSNSILATGALGKTWHGYIRRGVWEEY